MILVLMRMKLLFVCLIVMMVSISAVSANGFTVRSVSYFPYLSNDANISSTNVTLDIVVNDAGQSVSGYWSGAELPDGMKLEQPLKIEVTNSTQTITYPFENQGALYKYQAYYKDAPDRFIGATCEDKPSFCFPIDTPTVRFSGWDRVLVIKRVASGSYAKFGNGEIASNVDLSITVNNTIYKQSIGSGQTSRGSAQFKTVNNDYIGSAIWTGYSNTGAAIPNNNNYIGTYTHFQWRITNAVTYEQYVKSLTETDSQLAVLTSKLPDGFDLAGASWKEGYKVPDICKDSLCSDVVNLVTLHNAILDSMTSDNIQIGYNSPTSSNQKTTIGNGNVVSTIGRSVGNSEVILTLAASKIGVVVSTGRPEITNISVKSYSSGSDTGALTVTVKNIGDARGTFGISGGRTLEQKITLDSGASGEVTLYLANLNIGINEGTILAYDINTGAVSSQDYRVEVTEPKLFIPNSSQVYNDVIFKSSTDGMNQTQSEPCNGIYTKSNKSNDYECMKLSDIAEPAPVKRDVILAVPTAQPKEPPNETLDRYAWWVLISMVFMLVAFIFGLLLAGGTRSKKAGRAFRLIVVMIVTGAVVAVIVLYYKDAVEAINKIQFMNNLMNKLR